jgi:hypothetical protein
VDLYRIQNELIADRAAEAWFTPNIAGPFFHYRWTYGTASGSEGWSHVIGEHHSHAVLREVPSLTMGWGLEVDGEDRQRRFDWAANFPDPTVRPFWVDFFWNNALIDRVELASVDGGRGTIPMPHYGKTVTDYELAVAVLIHDLDGAHEGSPRAHVDNLGFTVVRDDKRWGAAAPPAPTAG